MGTQTRQREDRSPCSTVSGTSVGKPGGLGRLEVWGWNHAEATWLPAGLRAETRGQPELRHKPPGVGTLHSQLELPHDKAAGLRTEHPTGVRGEVLGVL